MDTYFLPADCLCNGQGALSFICDQMTGQCDCHANVVGRSCDTCQVDYYGLQSGAGCISCGCHTLGSLSTQCDLVTGDCQCRPLVTGRTCDTCVSGSYGPSSAASGCTSKCSHCSLHCWSHISSTSTWLLSP